ncbi:MAG: hypothetical protein IT349_12860 [Candidatus Eisenbacteria bacterium]|nr:hypothetical protein [Candidatus Eisenbacteria bacterium]MCC7142985.1 hypothetical protein [Candidatus Eisenbacteria bacterium]
MRPQSHRRGPASGSHARVSHLVGPLALLAGAIFAPARALAYHGGPPDGHASDPPLFRNCTSCHSSFTVNSGNGGLNVTGLPAQYTPGETYHLNVILVDPGQRRWGFELTVIQPVSGDEAGTLVVDDAVTTQISEGPGVERDYLKQTADGTFPTATSASWSFFWVAPLTGTGPAKFYLAGNAANNNANAAGDFIYTKNYEIPEGITLAVQTPEGGAPLGLSAAPNPLFDQVVISYLLAQPGPVDLRVLDSTGRVVRTLVRGAALPGSYAITWDGRDTVGRSAPAGVYFYLLNAAGERGNLRAVKLR